MRVSKSIVWNVCGTTLPLVVGIAVMPPIVKHLGVSRFGLLSIIWMMIGYLSVFDLGLSRTLTKVTADRVGTEEEREIPSLVFTVLVLVLACGVIMSIALAAGASYIAGRVLHVSPNMLADTANAILWLAIGLPFTLLSTVLFGVLEGFHKFGVTSLVRLPLGIMMFLVPFGILPFSTQLGAITAGLSMLRILVFVALAVIAVRVVPGLRREGTSFRGDQVKPLLTFGGWLTVSNIVGPLLAYFDRFVIAAVLGTAVIAYYTVPYDTLVRLLMFPTAIQGVLFPAFATLRARSPERAVAVFKKSSEKTALLMIPAVVAVSLFASEALNLWLGPAFASHSSTVAKVLILGVFINALSRAPFALVQGYGYAKWVAVLQLLQLPPYAVGLWALLKWGGVLGAAYAWSARIVVETVVLYIMGGRLERSLYSVAFRDGGWIIAVCAGAIALNLVERPLPVRLLTVLVVGSCCGFFLLRDLREVIFARDQEPKVVAVSVGKREQ